LAVVYHTQQQILKRVNYRPENPNVKEIFIFLVEKKHKQKNRPF